MALTDRQVRTIPAGRHGDGQGLYLEVAASGRRSWLFRFQLNGLRRDMSLGVYPTISLSAARIAAADARKLIAAGTDPIAHREAARATARGAQEESNRRPAPSFREVAALVIAKAQQDSSNAKVRYQWERHLGEAYCADLLDRPVHEIRTSDVADQLKKVWTSKPEVARKLYPAIRRVFEHARVLLRDRHDIAMTANPAAWADLKALGFLAPRQLSRGRHPSLAYQQMPAFMADLRSRDATAARALEFLILSNIRTDAVLKTDWADFDIEAALWTVPLSSLKDRKYRTEGFRVPLCDRAVEILNEMAEIRSSNFVFPGAKAGLPFSNMAMLTLLKRMNSGETPRWIDPASKRPITAHGFRASFRTWCEETTAFPHAVVEEAMGHVVGTAVERAYRRTDVLAKRRELMDAWSRYCEPKAGENVVSIATKANVKA
jgi:integrase